MAIDRRSLLAGLTAVGTVPLTGFAGLQRDVAFVTCCRRPDGHFAAAALDADGKLLFTELLDDRGHDAAVSPDRRLAVVFARRPGWFAIVLDLVQWKRAHAFAPRADRHLYGHGFFSPDGRLLYATENDFEVERGVLGIYDVDAGFRRIGEFDTHGIGPHEAVLMADQRTIVVANGGIATHPDFPRVKLNIADMRPSLAYLDAETGDLLDKAEAPPSLHQLSLRHMAQAGDGTIWFGGQYEGPETDAVPLVGTHKPGGEFELIDAPPRLYASLSQYVGSVAASADGARIATTSPRGSRLLVWDVRRRTVIEDRTIADVCGVAPRGQGFLASDGAGTLHHASATLRQMPGFAWDNHISVA